MKQTNENVSPMSNEGRNTYVIEHITEALIKLLQEKPIGNITISELCDSAGIGRASFYRNFESKEDILKRYISRETDKWLLESGKNSFSINQMDMKHYIVFLFTHMYKYRNFTDILMKNNKMHLLEAEFDRRFLARLSEHLSPWRIVYNAGGMYKLFTYWVKTNYEKSPLELAEIIMDMKSTD